MIGKKSVKIFGLDLISRKFITSFDLEPLGESFSKSYEVGEFTRDYRILFIGRAE